MTVCQNHHLWNVLLCPFRTEAPPSSPTTWVSKCSWSTSRSCPCHRRPNKQTNKLSEEWSQWIVKTVSTFCLERYFYARQRFGCIVSRVPKFNIFQLEISVMLACWLFTLLIQISVWNFSHVDCLASENYWKLENVSNDSSACWHTFTLLWWDVPGSWWND